MSHVVCTNQVRILDLETLAAICHQLGLKLVYGQTAYRWYGRFVGDSPMPADMSRRDLGRCEHAICVADPAKGTQPYEVGLVPAKDEAGGWHAVYDGWNGGYGLEEKTGKGLHKLLSAYTVAVTRKQLDSTGCEYYERTDAAGRVIFEQVVA